jgi:hypothetical protein
VLKYNFNYDRKVVKRASYFVQAAKKCLKQQILELENQLLITIPNNRDPGATLLLSEAEIGIDSALKGSCGSGSYG